MAVAFHESAAMDVNETKHTERMEGATDRWKRTEQTAVAGREWQQQGVRGGGGEGEEERGRGRIIELRGVKSAVCMV